MSRYILHHRSWPSSTRLQLYRLRFFATPLLPRSTVYFLLSVDGAVEVSKRTSTGSRVYIDTSIESIRTRPSNVDRRYWKCGHIYVDVRAATFGAEEEPARRRIDVRSARLVLPPSFFPSLFWHLPRTQESARIKKEINHIPFFLTREREFFKNCMYRSFFFIPPLNFLSLSPQVSMAVFNYDWFYFLLLIPYGSKCMNQSY